MRNAPRHILTQTVLPSLATQLRSYFNTPNQALLTILQKPTPPQPDAVALPITAPLKSFTEQPSALFSQRPVGLQCLQLASPKGVLFRGALFQPVPKAASPAESVPELVAHSPALV